MRHVWFPCLLLSLGPCFAVAQQTSSPAAPPATLHVDSQIVLLDVSVTDAAGKPVLDLRPDEFRITEQNMPQAIASFEPPSAHAMPAAAPGTLVVNSSADLPKIGQAPVTLLVIDELDMGFPDRAYAREKLLAWIRRQPAVLPQPTALLAINDKDLHLVRDYTQDRAALLDAIAKHTGDVAWRITPDSTSAAMQQNMGTVLGAIDQLAQATRGIPERKNLIWVGRGFPSVGVSDVGSSSTDAVNAQLEYLSDLLLRARVTLSVLGGSLSASDANLFNSTLAQGGTQTLADATEVDTNMAQFDNGSGALKFAMLAKASGGHNYTPRNDLDAEIERSVDEGTSFYTLSYRPTEASKNPKAYRSIRVTVTRPGLTVQTRDGYYPQSQQPALTPKDSNKQLAFDLNTAAVSTIPYTDLHVAADRRSAADFTLHASARDLTWRDLPDGRRHADVVLMAACFSPRGKLLAKNIATLGSNTDATLASIGIASAALPMHLVAPVGTARIRFVVVDMGSTRIGTVDVTP